VNGLLFETSCQRERKLSMYISVCRFKLLRNDGFEAKKSASVCKAQSACAPCWDLQAFSEARYAVGERLAGYRCLMSA
jgi:hypothetical protein